ncbi:MAG: hypothetical protein P9M07_05010 [Candidatus Aceula meridiana]|nr:hypothetical protein [Candidatus Aceula meridiana]
MSISIFIAKLLGTSMLVISVGLFFNRDFFQSILEDYCKNAALVFFGGVLALVVGLSIVLNHNVWELSWRVIITIYGWGGIIKGIWLIMFPRNLKRFVAFYTRNKTALMVQASAVFIFGVVLAYYGWTA